MDFLFSDLLPISSKMWKHVHLSFFPFAPFCCILLNCPLTKTITKLCIDNCNGLCFIRVFGGLGVNHSQPNNKCEDIFYCSQSQCGLVFLRHYRISVCIPVYRINIHNSTNDFFYKFARPKNTARWWMLAAIIFLKIKCIGSKQLKNRTVILCYC